MLWHDTSSMACMTLVFQSQSFHDSANMAQFWFPSHYLSLLVLNFWSSQPVFNHEGWKERRMIAFTLYAGRKRILSPQYLSFPFLPGNRPKANSNFVKQSSFPFWVMKRHHLVDVALRERLHQLAERISLQPIPSSVNGSIIVCIMKKVPLNNKYQCMLQLTKHSE